MFYWLLCNVNYKLLWFQFGNDKPNRGVSNTVQELSDM